MSDLEAWRPWRPWACLAAGEVATPFSRCRAFCRWLLRAGHQTIKVERVRRLRVSQKYQKPAAPASCPVKGCNLQGQNCKKHQYVLSFCERAAVCGFANGPVPSTEPSQPQCWAFFLDKIHHVVLSTLTLNLGSSIHNPRSQQLLRSVTSELPRWWHFWMEA
jgi:hypothetical protein